MILKNIKEWNLTKIIENTLEIILKSTVLFSLLFLCTIHFSSALIVAILFFFFYNINYHFIFYILCIGTFLGTFFVEYKVLHFEHWLIILSIIYIAQISIWSPLKEVYKRLEILGLVVITSVIFELFLVGNSELSIRLLNTKELILNIKSSIILIVISIYLYSRNIKEVEREEKLEKLYPKREKDKDFILNFLNRKTKINILGIEDNFGEGKTFLIKKVIEKLPKKQFEIIKIKCLLLDTEDIYPYIVKLINKVLIKNNIYTGHYEGIKNSFIQTIDNKFLGNFSTSFLKKSEIDDIENFKKAISTLNKNIVLIFDDFDRSSNSEKIEKLFSFIDDFSGNNVKSLVLYNPDNLKEIDEKFNRNYIEKYIPQVKSLTKLTFNELMERGLDNKDLNKNEFDFLEYILKGTIEGDFRSFTKFHFYLFFKELTGLTHYVNLEITPRKTDFFLEEVKEFLSLKNLKIERRCIIVFFFLKNFMYEEFYKKINSNFTFKETFPVDIQLVDKNITLTLDEIILLKQIFTHKKQLFYNNKIAKSIQLGKIKISFENNKNYNGIHINDYLKKFKIKKLTLFSQKEINQKLNTLNKALKGKMCIKQSSKNNALFRALFNCFVSLENNTSKIEEHNKKIENHIKKLKFIGIEKYQTKYQQMYNLIKGILILPKKEERYEKYIMLINQSMSPNIASYIARLIVCNSDEVMIAIDIFGNNDYKKKLLEIIFEKNKFKITDEYLLAFFKGNLSDIDSSDFIIEKFIENKFEICKKKTLTEIRNNIYKIIKRDYFIFEKDLKDSSNKNFYQAYSDYLENIISNLKCIPGVKKILNDSSVIKEIIQKELKFIKILIELEEKFENFKENDSSDFLKENRYINIEKIKNLNTKEEKIKALEKRYLEGKDINEIGKEYELIFNENTD